MGATSGIGSGAAGPWYRVQAILADGRQGASAERDYASVLPAVLNAAMHRRPFIAGWLSRGGGAPLELITNAGPLPEPGAPDRQGQAAGPQGRGGGGGGGAASRAGPSTMMRGVRCLTSATILTRPWSSSRAGSSARAGSSNPAGLSIPAGPWARARQAARA